MLSLLVPDSDATTWTPQGRIGTSTTSSSLASPIVPVSVKRTSLALGDLERLEHDFVDAVLGELDRLGENLVASAGVDRQAERELAGDAGVVHLGDEPRLVALGERAGDLEVDEEVLADRQTSRSSDRPACRRR